LALIFDTDIYFCLFGTIKIVCNLNTTGQISMQLHTMMYLAWFYKPRESWHIWP